MPDIKHSTNLDYTDIYGNRVYECSCGARESVPASVWRVWRENAKLRCRHQSQMLALATVADTAIAPQAWEQIREQIK